MLMGGIRDGVDAVKALCLGADAVAFGTSTIIAGGCIACMQCHIGQCVTGIATQDPEHEKRYDPEAESHNIHRFLEGVRWQIAGAHPRAGVHRLPRSEPGRPCRAHPGSGRDHRPAPRAGPEGEDAGAAGAVGLVAAHDLCVAGYAVHVYEMTDRLGGMMIWGIPAFRLPPGIIDEDVDRLMQRCPGLEVHLDTALGRDVSLEELKERHDAVLLTIGAWWGKPMGIPGEEDERVVDGVGFLRRVNAGERPEMPETVVVVGGGDVAMDACRVAKRLPGCRHVKVVYRRGPGEIPARKIELHHAIKEDVEFLYHTQQVGVIPRGNQLALKCVKTALGEPDDDGRRRPVAIEGSEHEILCGSVIAAVGQRSICEELHRADMMAPDRVRTEWDSMRTSDPMVFAAGDGAFGGSTIVMAMQHGQRAAYYLRHFLEGGSEITQTGVRFAPDRNEEERTSAVVNILEANAGEASMMARCAGKTRLHNIEPEDLRSVTRATAAATGIPLAGTRAA